MESVTVKLKYTGKEPTRIRISRSQSKIEIKPGDIIDVEMRQAQAYASMSRYFEIVSSTEASEKPKAVKQSKK